MDKREREREATRKWRAKVPERVREYNANFRARHPGYFREWYASNKKKASAWTKDWKRRHPGRVLVHNVNRLARVKGAEGSFTRDDVETLLESQDEFCPCGADISGSRYHIDHKTPLSRGGTNWPENLQLLCPPCNLRKHNKTSDEWSPARKEF